MRVYQADVWCDACGKAIEERLRAEGKAPEDTLDEGSYDSDDYPKWGDDDEESDCPQHCAAGAECLSPTIINGEPYGAIMGTLTTEGREYVKDQHYLKPGPVTRFWLRWYDLECSEECGQAEGHACAKCGLFVKPYDCTGKTQTHEDCE